MKFKRAIIGVLVLFATVYLVKVAGADIYCEREVTTNYQVGTEGVSKTIHQRVYLKQDMLKIEEVESGEATIVRLDTKLIFKLNPVDKTYTQSDFQALKLQLGQDEIAARQRQPQVGLGQDAVRKKMTEAMPAEQRSIMERMMQLQMGKMKESMTTKVGTTGDTGPAELRSTTDTKTMLGHVVKRLKVVQTEQGKRKKIVELWVTTGVDPKNYVADFTEALGLFHSAVVGELKKVEGFPLQMKYRIQSGPLKGNLQTVTVTELEEKTLLLMEFEVPPGYKPVATSAATPAAEEEEEDF